MSEKRPVGRPRQTHDDLLLAAKEAAAVIAASSPKRPGADPMKGTALPRLLAAIKKAEGSASERG